MLYSGIANSAIRSIDEIFEHINSGRKETIVCGGVGKQYVEYNMSIINKNNTIETQMNFVDKDSHITMSLDTKYNLSLIEMLTRSNGIMSDEFYQNKTILVGVVPRNNYVISFYVIKDILRMNIKDESKKSDISINLSQWQVKDLIECSTLIKSIMELYLTS